MAALVELLEQEGVRIEGTQLYEARSKDLDSFEYRLLVTTDLNALVVSLASYGSIAAIKAGARKFRERTPRAKVMVEGEDESPDEAKMARELAAWIKVEGEDKDGAPDDGGFMPDTQAGDS